MRSTYPALLIPFIDHHNMNSETCHNTLFTTLQLPFPSYVQLFSTPSALPPSVSFLNIPSPFAPPYHSYTASGQGKFSTQSDLLLLLSISSVLSCPVLSLSSSTSCLLLLLRLPFTCMLPAVFPYIQCCRRQLLRKMWPMQLAFLLFTIYSVFLYVWFYLISHTICPTDLSPYFCSAVFEKKKTRLVNAVCSENAAFE